MRAKVIFCPNCQESVDMIQGEPITQICSCGNPVNVREWLNHTMGNTEFRGIDD